MTKTIAIQGYEGSFHHAAALQYWGEDIELICCDTFTKVGTSVIDGSADHGLMAIENSIAGTILQNYRILREQALHISGEIYLRIVHHLLALPTSSIAELTSVESHPMAINQCLDFLKPLDVELVNSADTAGSAMQIAARGDETRACIASELAGQLHGLKSLATGIQTHPINYTRFFAIDRQEQPARHDKSSIYLLIKDEKGLLLKALQAIDAAGINLSKLQSFPAMRQLRCYYFHMDLEYDDPVQLTTALDSLRTIATEVTVLGSYLRKDPQL
jgi:prephenate dehydratase